MKAKVEAKHAGKSIADFRAAHDKSYIIPQRIREGLKRLGDGWEYEGEFIKLCGGMAQQEFARYRDAFKDHVVTTTGKNPKRCWAGTKQTAEKLREMLNG